MLSLPPSVRIFVAREPVDMRKRFDGLANAARQVLGQDPLSGHLCVFFNRTRTPGQCRCVGTLCVISCLRWTITRSQ